MNTRRITLFMKRSGLHIVAIGSVLFALAGVARAAVTSGFIQWIPDVPVLGGTTKVWLKADQFGLVQQGGSVKVYERGCNQVQWNLPPAHLGIIVNGWKNGGFCGSLELFSTTTTAQFCSNGINLCSNPSGVQAFQSSVFSKVWNGNAYVGHGHQFSPGENY